MRKLFRMYYEPCRGTCYAAEDILSLTKFSDDQKEEIIAKFVELHNCICGDSRWGLGIDVDTLTGHGSIYIGHIRYPEGTELFSDWYLPYLINKLYTLTKVLLNEYNSKPNLENCDHGHKNNFREFWLNNQHA